MNGSRYVSATHIIINFLSYLLILFPVVFILISYENQALVSLSTTLFNPIGIFVFISINSFHDINQYSIKHRAGNKEKMITTSLEQGRNGGTIGEFNEY